MQNEIKKGNINMKKFLCVFTLLVAAIALSSCGAYSEYIEEVKTGYLGGCLDVIVDEVLSDTLPNGKWDGGETDDGKIIVEYKSKIEDMETAIQFTITDENHFKVSGISVDGVAPETDAEGASLIESRYTQYYGNKYPDKAAIDIMPNEPAANLMQGISAAYAEKAKNPIDLSNYFDKSTDELKTTLGIEEKDGFLMNSEISLMYDDEAKRVDIATISGSRVYSLFGLQTFKTVEDSLNKISDRFEKVSEQDGEENTKSVMLIRNNSEDSLTVTYDTTTNSITEITYTYNGLEGYRAEQERLKKEAEEKAAAEAAAKAKAEAERKKKESSMPAYIREIKDSLGVPSNLDVTYKVSEPYYWSAGERNLILVDFYHNGQLVASVEADAVTYEHIRGILMYTGQ